MNRLALAFQAFFKVLFDAALAKGVADALNPPPPVPPAPPEPVRHDLRILALLQRDGRLVDFLMESIDDYDDGQVGSAARDIHTRCRKTIQDHFRIEPIGSEEGAPTTVPVGYDATAIRLTGNVAGDGPWKGTIGHPGWQVTESRVPEIPGAYADAPVLQPMEVEIS